MSKKNKKCIRDKKRTKRKEKIQKILEELKGTKNIPNIKSMKKRILIPKIKNMKGETITPRKGIADVFEECYAKLYDECEETVTKENEAIQKRFPNSRQKKYKMP